MKTRRAKAFRIASRARLGLEHDLGRRTKDHVKTRILCSGSKDSEGQGKGDSRSHGLSHKCVLRGLFGLYVRVSVSRGASAFWAYGLGLHSSLACWCRTLWCAHQGPPWTNGA